MSSCTRTETRPVPTEVRIEETHCDTPGCRYQGALREFKTGGGATALETNTEGWLSVTLRGPNGRRIDLCIACAEVFFLAFPGLRSQ